MAFDQMREQLRLLAQKLQKDKIKLIIGGGYGLILKHEYLRKRGLRTRFTELPEDRSTNDIDIFLNTEIITSAEKIETLRDVLQDLGYYPVANYFQFAVVIGEQKPELKVKIDLLSPPVSDEERNLVKINKPRIRPKEAKHIHGYLTEEAVTVEEKLIPFDIGKENESIIIFLPHPFTYLILKLFALRDRLKDEEKDFGAYHAFDIYRIIGMMTEEEWKQALELRKNYSESPKYAESCHIVSELFASIDSLGVARIRQHSTNSGIEISETHILGLISDLKELFPNDE